MKLETHLHIIDVLEKIVDKRMEENNSDSYIKSLLNKGVKEISKKVAEEAGETAICSCN